MAATKRPASRATLVKIVLALSAALVVGGMPFWFAGAGLRAYFTSDDMVNLYGCWSKPWRDLLIANVAFFSPFYRPLGGLFYRSIFGAFGFDPFPFRVACFAIMLVNLGLAYAAARRLAGSREIGLLAALITCYHAGFLDLYYNTGTVYDVLCFTFYVGAFHLYIRAREGGSQLRWRQALLVAGAYLCALNSKEMAVSLPLAVLIYEWVYHRPERTRQGLWGWAWRDARMAWLLAVLTVPYLVGKLSAASVFTGISEYQPHISVERYVSTYGHYLDRMFYQQTPWFTPGRVLLLWAGMLLLAALSRRRVLWFSFVFVWLSVLPVIFITPRGSIFVLYIPFLGWSLYGAALLVWVRDSLAGALARLVPKLSGLRARAAPAIPAITFAAAAAGLALAHYRYTPVVPLDSVLRSLNEQMHAMLPRLPAQSRILFLDEPFAIDDWSPFLMVRLSYGDATLEVQRAKRIPRRLEAREIREYDVVLAFEKDRLIRIDRAQLETAAPPQ